MHGKEKWPLQRGFEKFYGILAGGSSYLHPFPPRGITTDNGEMQYDFPGDYYTTDAFTTNAINFINDQKDAKPFFLYLAYNAPHWPLQAKQEDIALFTEKYKAGWDSIGRERLRKQLAMGLTKTEWGRAQREMRPWAELSAKEKEDVSYRMAVYAAQVYSMDQNIGKLIKVLKAQKSLTTRSSFSYPTMGPVLSHIWNWVGKISRKSMIRPNSGWYPTVRVGQIFLTLLLRNGKTKHMKADWQRHSLPAGRKVSNRRSVNGARRHIISLI